MSWSYGQPSKSVIMNIPDEMSSLATMNDLPNEILPLIFKHLRIQDLFRCRLVCKRFMFFCEEVKIPELIVSNDIDNFKEFWFHTNEQLNHKDAIDMATYETCQSTFRLDKCLKRLHFKGSYFELEQLDLNDLTNLEQLRLDVQKYSNPYGYVIIDLPNLKILEIGDFGDEFCIFLTAPKLEMLKSYEFDRMNLNLTYPETVVHLEARFHNLTNSLKNLKYLKVDCGFVPNRSILSAYPKLTTFVCNNNRYAGVFASIVGLRDLVEQKHFLKRHDLKIYFESVELVDSSKIDEYESAPSTLAFQMNNYDLLCDNVKDNVYSDILPEYNELMRLVKGKLPLDFHKKYINVNGVKVTKRVKSLKHLVQFLKSFDYLNKLHLEETLLDQSFYDRLPEMEQLTTLVVKNNLNQIANYDFLFKLKRLEQFSTDRDFPDFPDFLLALFKELKYFRAISFCFDQEYISISKYSSKYKFIRYKDWKYGRLELLLQQDAMNFDELVHLVNAFKAMKWILSNLI